MLYSSPFHFPKLISYSGILLKKLLSLNIENIILFINYWLTITRICRICTLCQNRSLISPPERQPPGILGSGCLALYHLIQARYCSKDTRYGASSLSLEVSDKGLRTFQPSVQDDSCIYFSWLGLK